MKCSKNFPIQLQPRDRGLAISDDLVNRILEHKMWYFPLISKYGLDSFSLLLRNRSIKSDGEASKACLEYKHSQVGEEVRGFEKNVILKCDSTQIFYITCVDVENGVVPFHYATVQWSDGRNILYTVCWQTDYLSWHVISKKKQLNTTQLTDVYRRLQVLGFEDKTKYISLSFDKCQ